MFIGLLIFIVYLIKLDDITTMKILNRYMLFKYQYVIFPQKILIFWFVHCFKIANISWIRHSFVFFFFSTQNSRLMKEDNLTDFKCMLLLYRKLLLIWFLLVKQKIPCTSILSLSVFFKNYSVNNSLLEVNYENKNLNNNHLSSCFYSVLLLLY